LVRGKKENDTSTLHDKKLNNIIHIPLPMIGLFHLIVLGFLLSSFVLVTILFDGSQPGYGQKDTNSTADATGYSTFRGVTISLQYPDSWELRQVRPFERVIGGEAFGLSSLEQRGLVIVGILPTNVTLPTQVTQEYIDSRLEKVFPGLMNITIPRVESEFENKTSAPSYDKYFVDGHRAGSVTYTISSDGLSLKSLFIGAQIGSNVFFELYTAPIDGFDQILPVAENILKS
jgi:hypothetical protein